MPMEIIRTAKEVVLLLGGTARTAELIKRSASNVSMWLSSNRIPARWVEVIRYACYRRGYWVESCVFGLPDLEHPSVPKLTLDPSSPPMASAAEGASAPSSSLENSGSISVLPTFSGGG